MKLLALLAASLVVAVGGNKKNAPATDGPNTALAKTYGGRVWASDGPAPKAGDELRTWLAAHPPTGELGRKGKEGPWTISYVAVFKRPAAKGPVTVKFFDKADQKSLVEESSSENDAATLVYQGNYELDPDHGFNKGHTYVLKVGQIIKGKFQPYASGELTLK